MSGSDTRQEDERSKIGRRIAFFCLVFPRPVLVEYIIRYFFFLFVCFRPLLNEERRKMKRKEDNEVVVVVAPS